MNAVAPALTAHGQVLALDQRGHGASDWPTTGYAPDDFARDLAGFHEALLLPPAAIVGHSLGGRTALAFAARYPQRLRGLGIVDVGASATPETIRAAVTALRAGYGPFGSETDALAALVGPGRTPNTAMRRYARYNLRRTPDGSFTWTYDLDAAIEAVRLGRSYDFWPLLPEMRAPTLVVRGALSKVLDHVEAARLAQALPRGALVELPGVGHLAPHGRPAELAAALSAWLTTLSASP